MRSVTTVICLLISFCISAQTLISKVYTLPDLSSAKGNTTRSATMFSGSGAILSKHEMNLVSLLKGKTVTYKAEAGKTEMFFVVKTGPVTVKLNGATYTIDRGSVIFVLPGDRVEIENRGEVPAEFYQMVYHSIAAPDKERGAKAGASFVKNWNDMVFKPHAKGGVRQLFDRQTEMLNRFDIHVTTLNAGNKSHEPHTHKNEEIILMMEGNAEMIIGSDHQKANGGDVVLLNSMIPHNLTNIGNTACLYFAIQWN